MRIVFLSRYQNIVERGVENYVSALAPRLRKLGYRVDVLTSLIELIGKKPDIVYPLNGGFQALFCRIYSWLVGAKLVLGGHAGIGRDDRWNLYMLPDLFIVFSKKGEKWARSLILINRLIRIIRIPHGVDLEKFSPAVQSHSGASLRAIESSDSFRHETLSPPTGGSRVTPVEKLDLEHPVFITVSHLLPYKRVGETVRAIGRLQKGSLIVLGEGPEGKNIDALGEKLLGSKHYLRLKTSHNVVPAYLAASDVFTLCSGSQEAFGLVYLEALATNLPIVATDDSLRHELIGEAGLFVKNPKDTDEYASALENAVSMEWGNKPRQQAARFSWDTIVERYRKEFSNLSI